MNNDLKSAAKDVMNDAGRAVHDAADTVKHEARNAYGAAAEAGRDAFGKAQSGVSDMASSMVSGLRDEAAVRGEALKDGMADEGVNIADTLRRAADDRGDESFAGRLLNTLADGVTDAADGLRGRSLNETIDEAMAYSRRNPGVFVAAAAIAGFALVRFARASGDSAGSTEYATSRTPVSNPFDLDA